MFRELPTDNGQEASRRGVLLFIVYKRKC